MRAIPVSIGSIGTIYHMLHVCNSVRRNCPLEVRAEHRARSGEKNRRFIQLNLNGNSNNSAEFNASVCMYCVFKYWH